MRDRTSTRVGRVRIFLRRWSLAGALLLSVAGCGSDQSAGQASIAAGPMDAKRLVAVLVAGDDSLPVFDHATAHMADELTAAGVPVNHIHLLSAGRRPAQGAEIATRSAVIDQVRQIEVPHGGSCLLYLTSHGAFENGLYLAASNDTLTPEALDQALDAGCGAAPTVLIVSACFAGQFAVPPMPRANRIILTAASPDRTSFGCGASFRYTYFDECLLGALGEADSWRTVFERTVACVAERERQVDAEPSEPIAAFGVGMTSLAPPGTTSGAGGGAGGGASAPRPILFVPGSGLFDPALVPIPTGERLRQLDQLARYAAAVAPKALAITAEGFLVPVTRDRDGRRTEDDVARLALERCEWLTGGACILYARDERPVELLPSGLPPFHPPRLVRWGRLTSETAPFIRDDQRPQIERYLEAATPKALALSPAHEEISIGHGAGMEEARRDALAQCRGGRLDCVIYAEDDRIVLGWGN
jgi:hypothetical protein